MGATSRLVTVPGEPVDGVGLTPWAVPRPVVLDMRRAARRARVRRARRLRGHRRRVRRVARRGRGARATGARRSRGSSAWRRWATSSRTPPRTRSSPARREGDVGPVGDDDRHEPTELPADNPFAAPSTLPVRAAGLHAGSARSTTARPCSPAWREQRAEVDAIASDPAPPTVENTLEALERSGRLLHRAAGALLQPVQLGLHARRSRRSRRSSPRCSPPTRTRSTSTRACSPGSRRCRPTRLRRAGARAGHRVAAAPHAHARSSASGVGLDEASQDRLRALNAEITEPRDRRSAATLLAATNAARRAGHRRGRARRPARRRPRRRGAGRRDRGSRGRLVPRARAADAAGAAGRRCATAALRERVFRASAGRGASGAEHDTRATLLSLARTRAERAQLLGYAHHAEYVAADATAKTARGRVRHPRAARPGGRRQRPRRGRRPGRGARARPPRAPSWSRGTGRSTPSRSRRSGARSTTRSLRPYLELERVLADGVFRAAHRAVRRSRSPSATTSSATTRTCACSRCSTRDGSGLGLFLGDYWTRESKRGGAWMNNLVDQSTLLDERARRGQQPQHPEAARRASRRCSRGTRSSRCSTSSVTRCTGCSRRCGGRRSPAPRCRATSSSTRRRSTRCGRGTRRSCARSRCTTRRASPCRASGWTRCSPPARTARASRRPSTSRPRCSTRPGTGCRPTRCPTDVERGRGVRGGGARARRRRLRAGAAALPHHVLQPHLRRRLLGRVLLLHLVGGARRRHGRVVPRRTAASTGANGDAFRARLLSRGGSRRPDGGVPRPARARPADRARCWPAAA